MPQLPIESYEVARSVAHAISLRRRLSRVGRRGAYLAGGTRLFHEERRDRLAIVDISRLGLGRIEKKKNRLVIGATVTLQALVDDRALESSPSGILAEAASSTSSWMIRNAATLGGLIAERAPDEDALTALLALDALVVTRGPTSREALSSFLRKRRAAESLIVSVELPLVKRSRSIFLRLARTANDVSLVSVACVLTLERRRVAEARLAVGGARPGPCRLVRTEALLAGQEISADAIGRVAERASRESALAGDARASAEYRGTLVGVLVRRALETLSP